MLLAGKKGLVLNVTNKNSIGWSVARMAHEHGAQVGVGAQDSRMSEKVAELVEGHERMKLLTVDFAYDDQLAALATEVAEHYGKIDFLVHSAAYAKREDLAGRFIETSRDGFKLALEISAYSFVGLCSALEPVLADDASIMAMSYLGSTRAVGNYNVMGVAKAALESCVRYLAVDLGGRGIRVNTVSPGPINTVAARGVKGLTEMIDHVHTHAPLKRPFGQEEVAGTCVWLMSDLSRGVSGQIVFIDNGYNVVGIG
ncbi:MAG: enoyl-ACP reductase [Fimbriimonadaceae bacterium]|nr:enoyl-ACP reductase [Fimbriimonadaceae bacterium]QYK56074.1 MAG: enoyl-ACP reductase [Fimbriimonadaceae bacterium]